MLGNVLSTCYLLCLFGRSSGGTVHPFCGLFRFIRLSAFLLIQSLRLQCGKKREKIALLGDELWHAMYYAHTNKYGESNVVWDSKCERSVGATVKQRCICCGACPHSPPPSRLHSFARSQPHTFVLLTQGCLHMH